MKKTTCQKNIAKRFPSAFSAPLTHGDSLYKVLKQRISTCIDMGVWKPGDAIPSEAELSKLFKISVATVRRSIDVLEAENILTRHQGKGTFVTSHDHQHYFFTFFRVIKRDGRRDIPKVQLLRFEARRANMEEAQRLNIGTNEPVFHFVNLLMLQGVPVIMDDIVVSKALFPKLQEEQLARRKNTIYSFYQQCFGINVVRTEERLRAITVANPVAQWLKVPVGSSVLSIVRMAYASHDRPIEYRQSYVNTQSHEYDAESMFSSTRKMRLTSTLR